MTANQRCVKIFDAHIAPEIAVNREFLAIYAFIVRVKFPRRRRR
jgi:hypothetical protein